MSTLNNSERAIAHIDLTGLPVQFKEERARAIGVWFADGQKLDDERFTGFNFYGDFLPRFQTIEKSGRRQDADIRIGLAKLVVLRKNFGIEQITKEIVAMDRMAGLFLERFLLFVKVYCLQVCARPTFERSLSTKNGFLQLLWPPAGRHTQNSRKHFDHRIGKRNVVFFVEFQNVGRLHLLGHEKYRHVANDFAGWRHFNDV